ncbi:MAG: MFS transporter, partial [Pseudomonadota bacterium]|nr:MFS transporter [Pseudomonadota bacterium]
SMVMMMLIFYYLWRTIRRLTGYTLEEVMAPHLIEKEKEKERKRAESGSSK